MVKWLLLAGAIVTEVTGSLALQGAQTRPLLYLLVAVGYVCSFVFLAALLRTTMPLGVAYGIWSAIGVALTAALAAVLYGQAFTSTMLVGIVLIIAGVLLVDLGSHPRRTQGVDG